MAIVACVDMLNGEKQLQLEVEKRKYSRSSCYSEKKKRSKVVYLKTQIQWILFYGKLEKWDWTLRRDTTEILRMHLVRNWKKIGKRRGQSGGIIRKGEPHERNPCAPDFEEQTPEETSQQADCSSKAAWNLARKIFKHKAEDKATFYSPVKIKAPVLVSKNTEERMFVVDSGASMHNAEQGYLSSDTMDTLRNVQKPYDGSDRKWWSAQPRGGTSVRSRFKSVRHSGNFSKKRQQFYRLVSFAQHADIRVSEKKRRNSTIWPRMGRQLFV